MKRRKRQSSAPTMRVRNAPAWASGLASMLVFAFSSYSVLVLESIVVEDAWHLVHRLGVFSARTVDVVVFVTALAIPVLTGVPLAKLTYVKLRWRQVNWDGKHCLSCGYDLTANISGHCPECGVSTPSVVIEDYDE